MPTIYRLNTKISSTMLCLSGFELYSRWVPLNIRNRGRVCLFLTTENEQLFILKTVMANYGCQ